MGQLGLTGVRITPVKRSLSLSRRQIVEASYLLSS